MPTPTPHAIPSNIIHHFFAAPLLTFIAAFITVIIASFVPGCRAAQLEPADILRGMGQ